MELKKKKLRRDRVMQKYKKYYQMKEESSKNNEKIFSKYQELKKLNRVIVDELQIKSILES